MRILYRAAACLQLLLVLCLAIGQTAITTSSAASTIGALPAGSYALVTLAPGPNTLTIDIDADGGYTGQFALKIAYQGKARAFRAWPSAAIVDAITPGATGIGANATGAWTATVSGPGYACVVATSLSSGSPSVFLSAGGGSNAAAGPVTISQRIAVAEFTRPSNTTGYTARDIVSNGAVLQFTVSGIPGGRGKIVGAVLETSQPTNAARHRLILYTANPGAPTDNAPFALDWTKRATRATIIDFASMWSEDAGTSTSAISIRDDVYEPYVLAGGSVTLYGVLLTEDAYTPTSGAQYYVRLLIEGN